MHLYRTPREAAVNIPFKTVRPAMQRAREEGLPHLPHTLSELGGLLRREENVNITRTLDAEDNIFAGMVGQTRHRTRCILLFSKRKLKYMSGVKTVFCDGTFVVPHDLGCSQIWTLITVRRHHVCIIHFTYLYIFLFCAPSQINCVCYFLHGICLTDHSFGLGTHAESHYSSLRGSNRGFKSFGTEVSSKSCNL